MKAHSREWCPEQRHLSLTSLAHGKTGGVKLLPLCIFLLLAQMNCLTFSSTASAGIFLLTHTEMTDDFMYSSIYEIKSPWLRKSNGWFFFFFFFFHFSFCFLLFFFSFFSFFSSFFFQKYRILTISLSPYCLHSWWAKARYVCCGIRRRGGAAEHPPVGHMKGLFGLIWPEFSTNSPVKLVLQFMAACIVDLYIWLELWEL